MRLLSVSCVLALLAGRSPAGEGAAVRVAREVRAAARAGDLGALERLVPAADPFLVLYELSRGLAPTTPEGEEAWTAAIAWVESSRNASGCTSLASLLTSWRALTPEQAAAETALEESARRLSERPGAEACAIVESARDLRPGVATVHALRAAAGAFEKGGRDREADEAWDLGAAHAAAIGWTRGVAEVWSDRGAFRIYRGDGRGAQALIEQELAIWNHLGDVERSRLARVRLAEAYRGPGDLERARRLLEEVLREHDAGGEPRPGAHRVLLILGSIHREMARYPEALRLLERARREIEERGETGDLARVRLELGAVYLSLRRMDRAQPEFERALEGARAQGDRQLASWARQALCRVHATSGRFDRARELLDEALEDSRAAGDRRGAARVLGLLGHLHLSKKEDARAIEFLNRALDQARAMGDRSHVAEWLSLLAHAYQKEMRYREALKMEREALHEFQAMGQLGRAASCSFGITHILLGMGHWRRAVEEAHRCLEMLLQVGRGLGETDSLELRGGMEIGPASNHALIAAWGLQALSAADRATTQREAFFAMEAGRAVLLAEGLLNRRSFLEAHAPPALCAARAGAHARLMAEERRLQVLGERRDAEPGAVEGALRARDAAYRELEDATARIEREARRVAEVVYPRPVDVQTLQEELPPRTAFLSYHLSDAIHLALVVKRDSMKLVRLTLEDPRLVVERYLDLASSGAEEEACAARLYDLLLRPIESSLADVDRLLLSPDANVLAFCPLQVLVRVDGDRRERAIERWEMTYVPSGTVHVLLRRDPAARETGTGLLALGDPVYPGEEGTDAGVVSDARLRGFGPLERLLHTNEEVRAIGELFPSGDRTVLLRENATVAGFQRALAAAPGRLRAVHLACHGRLHSERHRLTGLALTRGELLTLEDIYGLQVRSGLAVLSACETARGRVFKSEGVLGLVRGLFFAGCPRVLVSNWKIADLSTRDLMVDFYRRMIHDGLGPSAALRAAQLRLLRAGGRQAHPLHWGGFVLWGLPD